MRNTYKCIPPSIDSCPRETGFSRSAMPVGGFGGRVRSRGGGVRRRDPGRGPSGDRPSGPGEGPRGGRGAVTGAVYFRALPRLATHETQLHVIPRGPRLLVMSRSAVRIRSSAPLFSFHLADLEPHCAASSRGVATSGPRGSRTITRPRGWKRSESRAPGPGAP